MLVADNMFMIIYRLYCSSEYGTVPWTNTFTQSRIISHHLDLLLKDQAHPPQQRMRSIESRSSIFLLHLFAVAQVSV